VLGSWRSARLTGRRRRRDHAVHRPREDLRRGPLAGVVGPRILTRLVKQADDPPAALPVGERRPAHPEPRAEPAEEPIEKFPPPATQAPPRPPPVPPDRLESVPLANRPIALLDDDVKPERLDDRRRRVPAMRMEHARKDADRPLAAQAEVATKGHRQVDVEADDPEHLPPVHAVADDSKP